jgi:hypothetical protein
LVPRNAFMRSWRGFVGMNAKIQRLSHFFEQRDARVER